MVNKEAYDEAMDDVHTRFILNLPQVELETSDRIFFQLEQAWWFYDDFLCDNANDDNNNEGGKKQEPLPRFKHMKPFSLAMFQFSPLLRPMLPHFETMYAEFSAYKRSISTYGTILLNRDATKVALCRNWNGKSWTLPGGKVNQNERGKDAAARETYEETGFDPEAERGVCAVWKAKRERGEVVQELQAEEGMEDTRSDVLPWRPLQDGDKLVYTEPDTNKRRTCYVCRGVPENFPFAPVARKEVSEVAWHELTALPKHTYAVLPFLNQLRRWIKRDNRRRGGQTNNSSEGGEGETMEANGGRGRSSNSRSGSRSKPQHTPHAAHVLSPPTRKSTPKRRGSGVASQTRSNQTPQRSSSNTKKEKRDRSRGKQKSRSHSRSCSDSGGLGGLGKEVHEGDPLVESALASPGEFNRWTEEDMFATNERLLGRKITYDGNPHDFSEKGFRMLGGDDGVRVDPHAFRVVGGKFMNSSVSYLSAPPEASALQPLMARVRSGSRGSAASGISGDGYDFDEIELTPFFSEDGKAPWEEEETKEMLPESSLLVSLNEGKAASHPPVRSAQLTQSNSKGLALLNRLRQGTPANDEEGKVDETSFDQKGHGCGTIKNGKAGGYGRTSDTEGSNNNDSLNWFLTDEEITAKSQKEKLSSSYQVLDDNTFTSTLASQIDGFQNEHWMWMKQWVKRLPQTPSTKEFGDFRLDVDAIMRAMAFPT